MNYLFQISRYIRSRVNLDNEFFRFPERIKRIIKLAQEKFSPQRVHCQVPCNECWHLTSHSISWQSHANETLTWSSRKAYKTISFDYKCFFCWKSKISVKLPLNKTSRAKERVSDIRAKLSKIRWNLSLYLKWKEQSL